MKQVLSWGCGVQSTTLAAMSALGELEPLDAVITADTGWERQVTYEARDWYAKWLRERGIPVEIVSGGDIRKKGAIEHIHIPFFTSGGSPLKRQCTRHFKIMPIRQRIRELLGFDPSKPPHPPINSTRLSLGISLDEWARAKHSRVRFITHRWPLLEKRMSRQDCVDWLTAHDLLVPPKSACVCCPFRSASEWLDIKRDSPREWADAVAFDEANRYNPLATRDGPTADELYVWRGCEPLATADLEAAAARERKRYGFQAPMFVPCESGFCYV